MMIPSVLRRENAVTVGILEAIGIYLIYNAHLPAHADVRTVPAFNDDIESSRKTAAIESAALIGLVFAMTRDLNALIIGGVAMIGVDWSYKQSNAVNPATGKMDVATQTIAPNVYPLPDYTEDNQVG